MGVMRILLLISLFWSISQSEKIISCYTRPNSVFPASNTDPFLCTHLMIIGSTYIHGNFTPHMPNVADLQPILDLRKTNPKLKIFLTLTPSNPIMSTLVLNDTLMDSYTGKVAEYLRENDLDGFDLDWEFPVWSPDAKKTDKDGLSSLLKHFREKFNGSGKEKTLGLSLAVSAPYTITMMAYNISALNEYADFVQIMNYDYHDYAKYTPFTGFNSPLYALDYELWILRGFNSNYTTYEWLSGGLSAEKLVFGMPVYSRGYELLSNAFNFPYAPAIGSSQKWGDDLTYNEVCEAVKSGNYTNVWRDDVKSPYFYGNKQWVSYEDVRSLTFKAGYARAKGLGGIMIYDLPYDDYTGSCGEGCKYPLIKATKRAFLGTSEPSCTTSTGPESTSTTKGVVAVTQKKETTTTTAASVRTTTNGSESVLSRIVFIVTLIACVFGRTL
ncbi:hypothetical protein QR680_013963 [Steinernema hermaphroditum]|uniref:GH18 domain-containing protein n=1 Tax=Steinernema hermaphroditum TaxID=289476 RepID=A0AA39M389_9BILA|nr:hypothetical protein QR680_013963 [Steinernema hermaphroditum]